MSGEATGWVWKNSPYAESTLVIHLAIADVVNDVHDYRFWLSIDQLAAKCRVSRSTVDRALAKMVADGFMTVLRKGGGRGCATEYQFLMPEKNHVISSDARSETTSSATQNHVICDEHTILITKELKSCDASVADDRVRDDNALFIVPSERSSAVPAPARARQRDEIWDTVVRETGIDQSALTRSQSADVGKTVSELKQVGATPAQIVSAARTWRARYPKTALTHRCLRSHWGELSGDVRTPDRGTDAREERVAWEMAGWEAERKDRREKMERARLAREAAAREVVS